MSGLVLLDWARESKIFWRRAAIGAVFVIIVVICVWSLLDEGHQFLAVAVLCVSALLVMHCLS
jgi:choline-glycine betaine transporter